MCKINPTATNKKRKIVKLCPDSDATDLIIEEAQLHNIKFSVHGIPKADIINGLKALGKHADECKRCGNLVNLEITDLIEDKLYCPECGNHIYEKIEETFKN